MIELYPTDTLLIRNGFAVLTVYSYEDQAHTSLAVKDVINVCVNIYLLLLLLYILY